MPLEGASAPLAELDPDIITGEIDIDDVDILEETPAPQSSTAHPLVPMIATSFESPWQEWVQAYELLPADPIVRHKYLTKVADIWIAWRAQRRPCPRGPGTRIHPEHRRRDGVRRDGAAGRERKALGHRLRRIPARCRAGAPQRHGPLQPARGADL